MFRLLVVFLLILGFATPAQAAESSWTVTGVAPGSPRAVLRLDGAALSLAVFRGNQTVLAPSPLGIVTTGGDPDLRFVRRSDRVVVEHYRMTTGKSSVRTVIMREARFSFTGMNLVVRVSRDGVAYRYELPAGAGNVTGEKSAFTIPNDGSAWLAAYRKDNENAYLPTTAAGAATGEFGQPALFKVGPTYLLLAESDVDGRYSVARLVHQTGELTYRVKLWDDVVSVDGALATPWRTMIVGDLSTVTTSTLTDDLAPPAKIADTSWIHAGPVLWTWLAGGRGAGQSLEKQEAYVDYAAARHWPYEMVDAGWYYLPDHWETPDPNWKTDSWMPKLVQYGRQRGVQILVWIHFRELDTPEERAQWLPTLAAWGIKGLKIDFMDSEAQERLRWYDQVLPELAANHLMVLFHGSTVPHGIQRTWPNVMSMEGVHGQEKKDVTTSLLTTLPFTRNVIGSMDYTPEAFHRDVRPTTDAHELALSVLFESGFQDYAGTPESYDARPEARRFLEQVPAAWDETRLLAGDPGQDVVMARRSGDRWFIGGGFSGAARTVSVPLRLGAGLYLVDLVRDGLVRERHVMWSGQTLTVPVEKDGGFAAIACRWRPGLTSCDR
ncbi:glycoside hydrolase family 97 protein [Fodinicola acaciae]|uniref:glycoside hydrolase family 97 protein n=1 Tax=Fodinicola acaciae TaxID=2681555 RepID=UPI0013D0ED5D|nr:glycoside hydrolase family 97 protein [Fodinicola acaciae]